MSWTETEIAQIANRMRQDIVEMIAQARSGHPGGSLSAAEILAVLYFKEMNIDPRNPGFSERDRFVLSKGHAAPVLYAALAARGYFPREELRGLRKVGHMLQGHPDMRKIPGVDASTGSLGQGLSIAAGIAQGAKIDGRSFRVYALLGDGEVEEGMIWETAMAASHYRLDNLTAIIDNNGLQIDGTNEVVMNLAPLDAKWKAFGWHVLVVDGHCIQDLAAALDEAKQTRGCPTMIIAKTVKGKGVSFMENNIDWHGKAPNGEQLAQALAELRGVR